MGGKSTVWIVFKTISWLVFGDFVQLDSNVSNGFSVAYYSCFFI